MPTGMVCSHMVDTGSSTASLEGAAESAGADSIEAFDIVGNRTRVAVLLALWEAYDPYAESNAVTFSELRKRTNVRDSGQFNYHLGKLEGKFVKKTDQGYELNPVGLQIVQTVIAGFGTKEATIQPTEIDAACFRCDAPTAICYEDGWLYYLCTECEGFFGRDTGRPGGIIFSQTFPPSALSNRTLEEVFAVAVFRLFQAFVMKMSGVCPQCSGVLESSFDICEGHETSPGKLCATCQREYEVAVKWVCTVCKYRGQAPPSVAAVVHPTVNAFYHDHGIDIGSTIDGFEKSHQVLAIVRRHEQELRSTDPAHVLVTIRHEGNELYPTFDEEMNIIDLGE